MDEFALALVTKGAMWASLLAIMMYWHRCQQRGLHISNRQATTFVSIPLGIGLFVTGMVAFSIATS